MELRNFVEVRRNNDGVGICTQLNIKLIVLFFDYTTVYFQVSLTLDHLVVSLSVVIFVHLFL